MLLPRHLHLLPGRQSLGGVVAPALLPPLCCGPLRLRQEKTDTIRCIKSCRPNDVACSAPWRTWAAEEFEHAATIHFVSQPGA